MNPQNTVPVCLLRKGDSRNPNVSYLTPHELTQYCAEPNASLRSGTIAVQDYIDAAHPVSLKSIYSRCDRDKVIGDAAQKGFQFETYKMNRVSEHTKKVLATTGGITEGMEVRARDSPAWHGTHCHPLW